MTFQLLGLFQHTAARRRLVQNRENKQLIYKVSTHSRPKAAGTVGSCTGFADAVSTHSRPKAAGHRPHTMLLPHWVSTHSRPKAAGQISMDVSLEVNEFQHTAARRRLAFAASPLCAWRSVFQHTAARRRLGWAYILTSSRAGFNTQPPEGGWICVPIPHGRSHSFNTQPPEGGWNGFKK